jgi:hypothetical protein
MFPILRVDFSRDKADRLLRWRGGTAALEPDLYFPGGKGIKYWAVIKTVGLEYVLGSGVMSPSPAGTMGLSWASLSLLAVKVSI